jgi:predicted anti-sigma-YlaC factor YlaD
MVNKSLTINKNFFQKMLGIIFLNQKSSTSCEERKEIEAMGSRRKKMCEKVNEWIDLYCEGYIKKEIKEEIDRHLAECPSCQELKSLSRL